MVKDTAKSMVVFLDNHTEKIYNVREKINAIYNETSKSINLENSHELDEVYEEEFEEELEFEWER